MLKALENCQRTAAFTALLVLTRDAPADVQGNPDATARFLDLAVKCLIKISKALSDDLQVLHLLLLQAPRHCCCAHMSTVLRIDQFDVHSETL